MPDAHHQTQPRPRPLTRVVTNYALALSKSLTEGSGDHGDIKRWNPDLGTIAGHEFEGSSTAVDGKPEPPSTMHGRNSQAQPEKMADTDANPNNRDEIGWRKFVKYFTPSWFTVTMGTGIVSVLLNQFPYKARWLYWLSVIVFVLNLALFVLFVGLTVLRFVLWPCTRRIANKPTQALYLSTIPTTMSVLVNMMVFVCVPAWGEWVVYTAWGLWMADAVMSLVCALWLPFLMIKRTDETPLSAYTALQLFPIIATVVASASAAVVANVLPRPEQALATLIMGYVLWGLGLPSALFIMVVYFQRLAIHKLPPREVIVSCFMPIGPLGMGGFAIAKLGNVAMRIFPLTKTIHPLAGDLAYNLGILLCLVMWGFTLLWLFLAVASIHHCKHFPFNMGWWGFTFPIGTFALSSNALAQEIPSRFFRVIESITSVCVFVLWIVVVSATLRDLITGGKKLFNAPPSLPSTDNQKLGKLDNVAGDKTV
ncbi:Plasma membrane sulfite pump involved in sulfite metabolism [Exophiala sideris]|uniref:Plasma membrane sulfite pump involved in sulfite metabolism n=1 Tax=Exophiala sideris TaxID=1016849 RepID=A0ABR0JBC4_9EURO|nr:Plasma membrane sulfite pump involved in sulfite metabolism [Exophiala sideris]KAK5026692.1 Plasma membrane sulfite pump involved in sulfite metabolism [Exophiala sideris]KAK5059417.1 Plasma membrane sulfite pump involved in sulfite metabolism [Exophiala sideris]